METLIIFHSTTHKNTEKVARVMAEELKAKVINALDLDLKQIDTVNNYDLIGLGSGIFYGKHHDRILYIANSIPVGFEGRIFIFSTSGHDAFKKGYHKSLKNKLQSKGIVLAGEFNCLALDTEIAKMTGEVINRGKPDENDLENARKFAATFR